MGKIEQNKDGMRADITKVLRVKGMTCATCEMIIEKKLRKLDGISKVKASWKNASVDVTYDSGAIDLDKITGTIERLGYDINKGSPEKLQIKPLVGAGVIILALYLIVSKTIGFNFFPQVNQSMGYGIIFLVGFLTSIHCIAMCGGINLSQCVSYNNDKHETNKVSKLKPSLLYNTGRVISYTVIGGIVGGLGSAISFSGTARGIIAILAGLFMVIMGINLLNIFPWLRKFNPRIPRFLGSKVRSGNGGKNGPLIVGLLNGLMPCGPLQAMQLYALGTGSILAGATSMFLFSLGTVPLMFGFGAISTLLSSKFTKKMMRVSAVLVAFLGIIMLSRGLSLSGVTVAGAPPAGNGSNTAVVTGNVQTVSTVLEPDAYEPIVVQEGIPVRWTVKATAQDINGCNETMTIPEYGVSKRLEPGDNIIEFTPKRVGDIAYTCWMGMITSNISGVSSV
jgi:sulfite exporter TauE/SafE/copper chaperone CopZ